jgi:Ubiquitin-binding domain
MAPRLRQHVWTGRHRPARAHLGDVHATRKAWTRRSLDREREAFFETRVSNSHEIWQTLKQVVALVRDGSENDLATAQALLDAAGITVPSGDLVDGAYDENGNFYPLVEYIVSNPDRMVEPSPDEEATDEDADESEEERRMEKGKGVVRPGETIEIRARLSDRGGPEADIKIRLGKDENVRTLVRRIKQEANVSYLFRISHKHPSILLSLVSDTGRLKSPHCLSWSSPQGWRPSP